jgi:hypothetical protein
LALPPLVIKLRFSTWEQVAGLYQRDLQRNALFLRTSTPVALGREMRVELVLPSGKSVVVEGRVARHVSGDARGTGIELVLMKLPPSVQFTIETELDRVERERSPSERSLAAAGLQSRGPTENEIAIALEAQLTAYRSMNARKVLGLGARDGELAARTALNELCRRYHPDRFAMYRSHRLRALAMKLNVVFRDAYQQIALGTPVAGVERISEPQWESRSHGLREDDLFGDLAPPTPVPVAPSVSLDGPAVVAAGRLLEEGRIDEAIAAYDVILAAHPTDRVARSEREVAIGLKLAEAGNREGAAERFEAALELEPWNDRAARELAAVLRAPSPGRPEKAGLLSRLLRKGTDE